MRTQTGTYLAEQRLARRLTPQQLAAQVGYGNLAKGANRGLALERNAMDANDLLNRVVAALDVDRGYVQRLIEQDKRAWRERWEVWVNAPVTPQLIRRVIPAIWCRVQLADGLSKSAAVEHAKAQAVATGSAHALVWRRRETVWCHADGRVEMTVARMGEPNGPYMRLQGDSRPFLLGEIQDPEGWCGRGDSNPHGVATASPSSWTERTSIALDPGKAGPTVCRHRRSRLV